MKKIREKYGEEACRYKAVERRKQKLILQEEEQQKKENSMIPLPCRVSYSTNTQELMNGITNYFSIEKNENINLEIFLLKFERSLVPESSYNQIQKLLALLLYSNKTLSIHFSNPILAGSFQYDCGYSLNPVVDLILYHELDPESIKEAMENLIIKLKFVLKEDCPNLTANIINRMNETNLDIKIKIPCKSFSFRLMIRDDIHKHFIYYLKVHNSKVSQGVQFPTVFNGLRRIFRVFRRQRKYLFIKPEILDWVIKFYMTESLSDSMIKILKKSCKNLRKIFYTSLDCQNEIPEIIRSEVESLDKLEIENFQNIMKEILADLQSGDFKKIMKFKEDA
jgi:hypothetical protein